MKSKRVISNFIWRFLERIGAQLVTFIVSIVLARLLEPSVYGTIALVTVFTTIFQVFVDSGLGNALIQKKDADDVDFSTVFFFNLFLCILLYILMFSIAPIISDFYGMPDLIPVIRVLSITLIISGVKNVQQAYVSRNMLFKRFFFATLGGTIGAAIIGILMAWKGFGVWALVAQHLFNLTVDTIILWITVKWRPKFVFSFDRLKKLYSFGWKILVSTLLETVYKDLRTLIIGKYYTTESLAYYNKGQQFPKIIVDNINTSIDSVLLPAMSNEQDDIGRVRQMTRRSIKTSTFLMMPMMIGLAVCAPVIISVLLTDKWLPAVPFLRIFCVIYAFYPIHTANLNAIKALGRSDVYLRLEVMKKIVGVLLLLLSVKMGVMAMAYSLLITTLISMIINSWPNKELLNYSYFEQIKDMLPQIAISLVMGFFILVLQYTPLNGVILMLTQIFCGVVIYILLSKIFKVETFCYLTDIVTSFLQTKGKKANE